MKIHRGTRGGKEGPISVFRIYHRGKETRVGRNKRAVRPERGEVLGMGGGEQKRERLVGES